MATITLNEAAEFLKSGDDYLLLSHVRPDGDTVGSTAALTCALRRLGKTAFMFENTGITEKYLPFAEPCFPPEGFEHKIVISVDTASAGMFPTGWSGNVDLAIDHHPSNTGFAGSTLLRGSSSSCGEIVLDLIGALLGGISKEEADLLYVAVSTDTGCFQYGNTNADTFRAAAALAQAGADISGLNKRLFRTFSKSRLTLEGLIYSTLRSYDGNSINIAVITQDMIRQAGATEDDMDDLASLAGRVAGSKVSATIRETEDGRSKVSLRSGAEVNASDICAVFGGGGHAMAAGCTIPCPPGEAAARLLPLIREAMG